MNASSTFLAGAILSPGNELAHGLFERLSTRPCGQAGRVFIYSPRRSRVFNQGLSFRGVKVGEKKR